MIVLGIDTATSATAAALLGASRGPLEARDDPPAGAHPGHATRLLAMIDELLAQAGLEIGAVERIAVGTGPGTFTGLRVGMASARALAQGLGCELAPVSSLLALARGALGPDGAEPDSSGAEGRLGVPLLAAIDARRGEIFAAVYAASGEELAAPRALSPGDVGEAISAAGAGAVRAVGDGAVRYRAALEAAGAEVPPDGSPLHLVRARAVCELGLLATPIPWLHALPDYLRRPDAELALEAAGGAA